MSNHKNPNSDEHKALEKAPLAYFNPDFLNSPDGRIMRILAEYAEPLARFRREKIQDTVVFFGSARFHSLSAAQESLTNLEKPATPTEPEGNHDALQSLLKRAHAAVEMARYYEDARQLAHMLTDWTKALPGKRHRFVVTSGGGPGIMEAANRGARESGGKTIGLNIRLPFEQAPNPYITPELNFEFHYFFMRKYWFAYLAKALVVFPGGFGTLDELFEILTLAQTQKLAKKIIVIVYGKDYWSQVLNLAALADSGAISPEDHQLFSFADSPQEAFHLLKEGLTKYHLDPHTAKQVPEEGPEIAKTLP
ncbi:MAG TPA: TIGR00730 family Rossman fold protein [Candidatus Angelobacter sp.]|nr:TIGR00730 family Rossman fold protein [Candidatus Angelobacter sp.]